ncbi:MAG: VOC family protein [Gammaproteobacteria bacterium]
MSYTPSHHCLDYVEIAATDLEANKAFFTALFGWTFTDYGPDYVAFEDGRLAGGFHRVAAADLSVKGPTLIVFFSEDLAATQASVEEAGGSISVPVFEFPGGRRFHFLGPDHIEYAVWAY